MADNLCDTNVWLALAVFGHVHQQVARDWLESVPPDEQLVFCRSTQQSFLRLLTNASLMARQSLAPLTNQEAWEAFEALLADDRVILRTDEPDGIEGWWRDFSIRRTASTKLWMDAYLAAFARASQYRFVTTDVAFTQFEGIDVVVLGERQA